MAHYTVRKLSMGTFFTALLLTASPSMSARAGDAKLGTPQKAGRFQVTLTTNPATPQVGDNRFRAEVTRGGKPVADAQVTLHLTMPLHRHGGRSRHEPQINTNLFPSGRAPSGWGYARFVRLSMNGPWQAHVRIRADGEKGSAYYWFRAGKATPKHLGMEHPAGPFRVVLTTNPPTPMVGDNHFQVQVTRKGQPVTNATVNLSLALPSMPKPGATPKRGTTPTPGANITLKPVAGQAEQQAAAGMAEAGVYEGVTNLFQAGDWEAHINIQSGADWATAFYQFSAASLSQESERR